MINHHAALLALRTRLLTTELATTGVTTLAKTETGYTRGAGSFITDGFKVGMEVTPTGFTATTPGVIQSVDATTIVLTTKTRTAGTEAGGGDEKLTVGIPALRSWENVEAERIAGRWFLSEDYIFGPVQKYGLGQLGQVEETPMYVIRIEAPSGIGTTALFEMIQTLLETTFPPTLAISLAGGDTIRVRTNPAPFGSQPVSVTAGTIEVAVTIPLIARTQNPI